MLSVGGTARRAVARLSLAVLACSAPAIAAEPFAADDAPTTVRFSGPIDAASVAAFIATIGDRTVQRIVVTSDGGEVTAGLRLGNWIVDRGLDVEVRGICASSCANYLFTAGRHRIIDDGAIVIWHGSALQENFREMLADCPRRISELEHAGGELVDRYQMALDVELLSCAYFVNATAQQAAFFARIGVDETITRMGQEPRHFDALWTVSVPTMSRFGIGDVQAPAGYASHEYLKRFNSADDPEPILALGFDEAGIVVEEAR